MRYCDVQFDISPDLFLHGLKGVYLAIGGLTNRETDPGFEVYQAQVLEKVRADLTPESIRKDPILQGFRDLHTSFGFSNRNFPAASETLLENLLKLGQPPHVNLLVDIYNLVSIETHLALGAHDLDLVTGNIHLRPMTGSEGYWPLGSPEPKRTRPGGYAYIDDANEVICVLDSRQVEKTKTRPETTDCFYIIQGNEETDYPYIRSAAERLIALTQRFCGGEARMLFDGLDSPG